MSEPEWDAIRNRPASSTDRAASLTRAFLDLNELTARLRRDCPWDREQTARSIVPHTVEEAYEVADAAYADDPAKLLDELGDLLFQVTFLAVLLDEDGEGDLEAVIRAVEAKLVRRHPHVFAEDAGEAARTSAAEAVRTAGQVRERWEALKTEKEGRTGIFHDVPASLPSLLLARKTQRRAAAVGFDWPDLEGPVAKVEEELTELNVAAAATGPVTPEREPDRRVFEEVGDVLFAVVNLARHLNVDPELALRGSTRRFVSRVEGAEQLAASDGHVFAELPLAEQDRYYSRAKGAADPA